MKITPLYHAPHPMEQPHGSSKGSEINSNYKLKSHTSKYTVKSQQQPLMGMPTGHAFAANQAHTCSTTCHGLVPEQ